MPRNPAQHPDPTQPGGWFHDIVAEVLFARGAGTLGYQTHSHGPAKDQFAIHITSVPAGLVRFVRRRLVRAGKEWATYILAQQAKVIEDLLRTVIQQRQANDALRTELAQARFSLDVLRQTESMAQEECRSLRNQITTLKEKT